MSILMEFRQPLRAGDPLAPVIAIQAIALTQAVANFAQWSSSTTERASSIQDQLGALRQRLAALRSQMV